MPKGRVIRSQPKQSGVRGISWHAGMKGWYTRWREGGKVKQKMFVVNKYMAPESGKSYEEADAEALRDAIALRERMVKAGVIKAAGASHGEEGTGVMWFHGSWRVAITVRGKRIHGGTFRPADETPEELERARLAAVERRRQLELEHRRAEAKPAAEPRRMLAAAGPRGMRKRILGKTTMRKRILGKTTVKSSTPDNLSDDSVKAARLAGAQRRGDSKSGGRDHQESVEEASSSTAPQPLPSTAALARKDSQQGGDLVRVEIKRSGVQGISWHSGMHGWYVRWRHEGKMRQKMFYVRKGNQESDAEALRRAIAFRESLAKDGAFKTARSRPNPGSGGGGVCWCRRGWRVYLGRNGRRFSAGLFRPRDGTPEEVERARLAAVERRQLLEMEHERDEEQPKAAAKAPERPRKPCESGVAGVSWDWRAMAWCSRAHVLGKQLQKTFRPTDYSEEAVEVARLAAVRHRADLERRILEAAQVAA